MRFKYLYFSIVCSFILWSNLSHAEGKFYDFYSDHPNKELHEKLHEHYPDFSLPKNILDWENDKGYNVLGDGYMQVIPVGPLQMWAVALPGKKFLIVYQVKEGGVASKYKLQPWDEIHAVNGRPFTTEHVRGNYIGEVGPIKELGEALDVAHAKGGLVLTIKRKVYSKKKGQTDRFKMVTRKLPIRVEKLGRFSRTYPARCKKSAMMSKEIAQVINTRAQGKVVSNNRSHGMAGLALLAYGDPSLIEGIEEYANLMVRHGEKSVIGKDIRVSDAVIDNSWINGFNLIFLAEYFWATGDEVVFATLQSLAYSVSKHQNIYGGSGHAIGGRGSYYDITFGPPGALNILGLALAEKVGCKVDKAAYQKYYDSMSLKVVKDTQIAYSKYGNNPSHGLARAGKKITDSELKVDPARYYAVGYMAKMWSSHKTFLGESALNTAVAALALQHAPAMGDSKLLSKKLVDNLNHNPHSFTFIHATPSLGMFWCSLAVSSAEKRVSRRKKPTKETTLKLGNQSHMNYRKFWLTLSRSPTKDWFYFYPKHARNSKVGGGWGGDNYLWLEAASLYQPLIMLTSHKRNLLMQGNRRRNWLNPKRSPKATYAFLHKYHAFYATKLLEKAIRLQKERKYLEAYHVYSRLLENYSDLKCMRSLKPRYAAFVKKLGKKNLDFKLKEEEGQKYLDFVDVGHARVGKLGVDFRKSLLYYVAEKFKGHPIAKKALAQAEIDVSTPKERKSY